MDYELTENESKRLNDLAAAITSYSQGRRVARSINGLHVSYVVGAFYGNEVDKVKRVAKAHHFKTLSVCITPEARWTGAGDSIDLFYTGSLVVTLTLRSTI